jgi:hypothetical protein
VPSGRQSGWTIEVRRSRIKPPSGRKSESQRSGESSVTPQYRSGAAQFQDGWETGS